VHTDLTDLSAQPRNVWLNYFDRDGLTRSLTLSTVEFNGFKKQRIAKYL
jgi:hypothetical protein